MTLCESLKVSYVLGPVSNFIEQQCPAAGVPVSYQRTAGPPKITAGLRVKI